jgi:hypothetical protein
VVETNPVDDTAHVADRVAWKSASVATGAQLLFDGIG